MKNAVFLIFFLATLGACSDGNNHRQSHQHPEKQYTCPMHPQVIRDMPGSCPVCGMDLVEKTSSSESSADLMLTENQAELANVIVKPVTRKPVGQSLVINGRLVVNEEASEVISSRAAGRIEKLFVKETGNAIRKGEPLYVLYSETLLTLQREYLLAREQFERLGQTEERYKSFVDAAEKKLLLYGLTRSQITRLKDPASLRPRVTFLSPAGGLVTEVNASEGQYVGEGTTLYKIEDIGTLWVEAELYPAEAATIKVGDMVGVRISGAAGDIDGRVTFLSPEFRNDSQIMIARVQIDNTDNRFKPGQQAQLRLTHSSSREVLAVPADALIRDETGSHVYLLTGNNTFRPTVVQTGAEGRDLIEITEGLKDGDTIAVSGAYLLYSEFVLRVGN